MALVLVFVHCFCWWFDGLSPSLPWPLYECAHWSPVAPYYTQPCDLCCVQSMPKHKRCLRGKQRRGSPWRPQRPSFFSPVMPPSSPSLHLQDAQPKNTPPAPPTASTNCLEVIPRSPCASLRLLLAPPGNELPHPHRSTFPRVLGEEPPPSTRKPGSSGFPSFDATTGEQVKDNLAILYSLVFELRQGVEDLQFRLQLTNDKVALFLQLLSSMHETFLSTPEGATSRQEPEADTAEGQVKARATSKPGPGAATTTEDVVIQCATKPDLERARSATIAEKEPVRHDLGTETNEEVKVQWGDKTTVVEEEPWTGDLNTTWPGYMSGV
jgi:hypothetical protein